MTANSKRAVAELRQTLQHQERIIGLPESSPAVVRDMATQMLSTISDFLNEWNQEFYMKNTTTSAGTSDKKKDPQKTQRDDDDDDDDFPVGIVRHALSCWVLHLGYGDGQLRSFLLDQLINHSNGEPDARQLLLDFLPATMPVVQQHHQQPYYNYSSSIVTNAVHCSQQHQEQQMEAATQEVIVALRDVLTKEPSALLPIIGCLSNMPMSQNGQNEIFQVAFHALELVPENDLPLLVSSLFQHAASDDDAVAAIEALRTELAGMESEMIEHGKQATTFKKKAGDDSMTMVAHVVLNALFDEKHDNRIARAYSTCLERLFAVKRGTSLRSENGNQQEQPINAHDNDDILDQTNELLLLDMVVLLTIYQHPEYLETWESRLDKLLENNSFPFGALSRLAEFVCSEKKFGRPTSILYPRLISPFVATGIFLLVSPARLENCSGRRSFGNKIASTAQVLKKSHDFVVHLHRLVDREVQAELVHSLLQLSDNCANSKWTLSKRGKSRKRNRPPIASLDDFVNNPSEGTINRYEWFQVAINDTVNKSLQTMTSTSKQSFANFKHILVGRLTNLSFQSTQWEHICIQHLCGILSVLIEPVASSGTGRDNHTNNGGGVQASEIMIILQKLLFTSSHAAYTLSSSSGPGIRGTGNNRRIVRGLLLAAELVKSPLLSHGDWGCVKQWVLRVLLPTTRRMVDPEIGTPGLLFLEALMIDRSVENSSERRVTLSLKKEAFQHIKMVLANTGLIQMLSHYQQQQQRRLKIRRSNTPILAFLAPPGEAFMTESTKKRKKRDMVFCLAFFLENSNLHIPLRWEHSVSWVFCLVDTYLRIGRDISLSSEIFDKSNSNNKWVPHGWLQAAIEYPALISSKMIDATNKKQNSIRHWIDGIYRDAFVDEVTEKFLYRDISQNGLVDFICVETSVAQLGPLFECILKMDLASLLGISLSLAVANNAFKHYQSFPGGEESKQDQIDVLRLIQFQMFKVYCMEKQCGSLEFLTRAALLSIRKLNSKSSKNNKTRETPELFKNDLEQTDDNSLVARSTSEDKENKQELDSRKGSKSDGDTTKRYNDQLGQALKQLRNLKKKLLTSVDYILPEVIFACLIDDDQDEIIKKCASVIVASGDTSNHMVATTVISLRKQLLEHAIGFFSDNDDKASIHQDWFRRTLGFGLYICSVLPKLRKVLHHSRKKEDAYNVTRICLQSLTSLAAHYLRFIVVAMHRAGDLIASRVDVCSQLFQTDNDHASEPPVLGRNAVEIAFGGFLSQLQACDDATIAYEFLEILSLLAVFSKSGRLGRHLMNANWKALHTIYVSSTDITAVQAAYPIAVVQALTSNTLERHIDKCLKRTILNGRALDAGGSTSIRKNLLLHWGLLVLFPRSADIGIDHFVAVQEELTGLLESLEDEGCEKSNDVICSQELTLDEKTATGRNSEKTNQSSRCNIPGIHGVSFSVAFETLLHVSVAAIGALSVNDLAKQVADGGKLTTEAKTLGPYRAFGSLMAIFHSTVDLFLKRSHLFPRRTLATICISSNLILNMTINQVRACVDWRNAQPLLSMEKKKKGHCDPGAVASLHGLLNSCWTHTIRPVLSFCEYMISSENENDSAEVEIQQLLATRRTHTKGSDDDDDYIDNDNDDKSQTTRSMTARRKRNHQRYANKANALRHAAANAAMLLKDIAESHNLAAPEFELANSPTKAIVLPFKRKFRGDDYEGFHRLQGRSKYKQRVGIPHTNEDPTEQDMQSSKEKVKDSTAGNWSDEEDSDGVAGGWDSQNEDISEDDEGEFSSVGFGAIGNWGEDDDSKKSGSSSSLEMETELFETVV